MSLLRIGLLLIAFSLGIIVLLFLIYVSLPVPYSWNHLGIIVFITLPLSFIMDMLIYERSHHNHRMGLAHASLVALYALLFYGIHFLDEGNRKFGAFSSLAILISSWLLSAVPFVWSKGKIAFSLLEAKATDYVLFATSLMWYSPLFAELLVLLNWQLQGVLNEKISNLVLGEAGLNDTLFILGFATLVSSGFYAIIMKYTKK